MITPILSYSILRPQAYLLLYVFHAPETYAPLTDDEAAQLLASEAVRYMSFDQFKEWGIPVIGHKVHNWRPADSATPEGLTEHKGNIVWLTFEDPETCFILRAPDSSVVIDGFRLDTSRPAPQYPVRTHAADDSEGAMFAAEIRGEHWDRLEGLTEEQEDGLFGGDNQPIRAQP